LARLGEAVTEMEEAEAEMVARTGIKTRVVEAMGTGVGCGTYPDSEVVPVEGRAC
jgi:hypothetical protein